MDHGTKAALSIYKAWFSLMRHCISKTKLCEPYAQIVEVHHMQHCSVTFIVYHMCHACFLFKRMAIKTAAWRVLLPPITCVSL